MQYNRVNSESALIDVLKALERRVSTVETKGTMGISFVDPETGVETIIGELPDGTTGFLPFVGDTVPPPVPSVPIVSSTPGILTITWNGVFANNEPKPTDFQYVNIIGYQMTAGNVTKTTSIGRLRTGLDSVIVATDVIPAGETWQFSLVSEDFNGNLSVPGGLSALTTQQSFASDALISGAIAELEESTLAAQEAASEAQTAAGNAQAAATTASETAAAAAGLVASKSKTIIQDGAPAVEDRLAQNLWIDTTGGANTPKRWNGSAWVAVTDKTAVDAAAAAVTAKNRADEAYNLSVTASETAGLAQTAANGKNRTWRQATAPSGTAHTSGDIWFDIDDGNKPYLWVTTGTPAWTSAQDTTPIGSGRLDAVVIRDKVIEAPLINADDILVSGSITAASGIIGSLDIGKVTTGTLSGNYIDVKSIRADHLLLSSSDNLIVEAAFEHPTNPGVSWSKNANITVLPTGGRFGTAALRFTGTTTGLLSYNLNNRVIVDDDQRFRASMWVKANEAYLFDNIRIGVRPYSGATPLASMTMVGSVNDAASPRYVPSTNTWVQVSGISDPLPVNTTSVEFYIQVFAPSTTAFVDFDSVTVTRASDARLIVDGTVTADKLETQLVLTTQVIAGDPLGTHASMNGDGFRVYSKGEPGMPPYETARLGVASMDDLFSISDATGTAVAQIDQTGTVSAKGLEAVNSMVYKGTELQEILDDLPRGLITWKQFPRGNAYTWPTLPSAGGEVGLFEIGWDTSKYTVDKPRMYAVNVPPLLLKSLSGAATTTGLIMRFTDDGTAPTVNSPIIFHNYNYTSAGGFNAPSFNGVLISSLNGADLRVLVTMWATGGCSIDSSGLPEVWVEDLGPQTPTGGSYTTAGGTVATGTVAAAPVKTVATRTIEYGYTGVRSFLPNDTQYSYNVGKAYQGLSPAGLGNLRSMYTFPSVTAALAGAVVNDIWVYLYFEHWYNNAGGTAKIGLHPNTALPASWNTNITNQVTSSSWPKAAGRWVRLPNGAGNSIYDGFQSGAWRGVSLLGDGTFNSYGIANNARLRIRYTK